MEFLESHTTDKAIWKNDTILGTIQTKEHSDNEINDSKSSNQNNDKEHSKEEEDEEEEGKEKEQKIANKVISDLEVILNAHTFLLLMSFSACIYVYSVLNSTWNP